MLVLHGYEQPTHVFLLFNCNTSIAWQL